jgi:Undecaprenyl-phosphate glucose phosphotransferase
MPVANVQVTQPRNGVQAVPDTSKKRGKQPNLALVIALDLFFLNLSVFGFMLLQIPSESLMTPKVSNNLLLMATIVNVTWLMIVPFTEVYRVFEGIKPELKIRDLFWYTLIYFGITTLIYYQFFFEVFQVNFITQAFIGFFVFSCIGHYAIRYYNRNITAELHYAVIGGGNGNLRYLNNEFSSIYGQNAYCVGRFGHDVLPGVENLGSYDDIEAFLIENSQINKLLYFYSDMSKSMVKRIIQLCRTRYIDFEIVPIGVDFFERGIQVEQLAHLPIFRRKKEPLCLARNQILKRAFDIVFSLAAILLVFPILFPIVMLLIKLESKGPIFFIQKRTGYWNKPFSCIKFRTMRVNESSDSQQATKGDMRITWIGSIMRKTNIDELPQFFNVLWGDMSVVGPRPHMVKHTEDYANLIDEYMIRHEVKPGVTGWAQVNGWRGPTEELYQMAKRVEFDVHYIENWSFWFDCRCIFLTVFNMVKGEENAF